MARTVAMTYPLDKPIQIRPGVMHRESDFHGNTGKWYSLPPESAERVAKGDVGQLGLLEPQALTTPGAPFTLKK